MPVTEFTLTFHAEHPRPMPADWAHAGVVSSGDLEVLIENNPPASRADGATFHIRTKAAGFEEVWKKVLENLVQRTGLSGVTVHINDNAATPPVVARRVEQAIRSSMTEGVSEQ